MNDRVVIRAVIFSLALITFSGMAGVFFLIHEKVEGASIAILAGFVGTALGSLSSVLNNTRSDAAKTEITNTAANPVQTHDTEAGPK